MTVSPTRAPSPPRLNRHTRRPHQRRVNGRLVEVSQAVVRTHHRAREASVRTAAHWQALTAPGDRRERARYAAKLGLKVGTAGALVTGVVVGQVASTALSVAAAVVVGVVLCLGSILWAVARKAEPRAVYRVRRALFRARRRARPHIRRAAQVYAGTRQRTTRRRA